MKIDRKTFNGGLNTDKSDFSLAPNEYRNAENVRMLSTDNNKLGYLQNILGNKLAGADIYLPSGDNKIIGTCEDKEKDRLIYFLYNSEGNHEVRIYNKSNDGVYVVLKKSDFDENPLLFSLDNPITGASIINGMLFWSDPVPHKINIDRILDNKLKPPYSKDFTSLIKRPPNYPLIVSIQSTNNESNLKDHAYQFSCRYIYYDGEKSVLSPYSELVNFDTKRGDNYYVNLLFSNDNDIDQDVRFVEFLVRDRNTGKWFVVKRWDRERSADKTSIESKSLNVIFRDKITGEGIDEKESSKLSEYIPHTAKALEISDRRVLLSNYKIGYNTPHEDSLSVKVLNDKVDIDTVIVKGRWITVRNKYKQGFKMKRDYSWCLEIIGQPGVEDGYYGVKGVDYSKEGSRYKSNHGDLTDETQYFSFPTIINFSGLDKIEIKDIYIPFFDKTYPKESPYAIKVGLKKYYRMSDVDNYYYSDVDGPTITGADVSGEGFKAQKIFKSNSVYKIGKVFYDRYLRSSFVVNHEDTLVNTHKSEYDQEMFTKNIKWELSNNNARNEIPKWAEYYAIVRTKNLSTRFFLETYPYEIAYVDKTENYELKKETYDPSFAGIAVGLKSLSRSNIGYQLQKGDMANLYMHDGTSIHCAILDQWGEYIILPLEDIGDLQSTKVCKIEIYTPYKSSETELFYEVGNMMPIDNPGKNNRSYRRLSGKISGDTFIMNRKYSTTSSYGVEAMNADDAHYNEWISDIGRPNTLPIPHLGETTNLNDILYSGQYIPGTLINGLNSFSSLNKKTLPSENGAVTKLINATKSENEPGGLLLAICSDGVVSVYLGATRVETEAGGSSLIYSPNVIGSPHTLKGVYGTINPESVARHNKNVYFLDIKRGAAVRYSTNGLYPISKFGLKEFFSRRCKALELSNERLNIPGGYDFNQEEYLVSIPGIDIPRNILEDYTAQIKTIQVDIENTSFISDKLDVSEFDYLSFSLDEVNSPSILLFKVNGKTVYDGPLNNGLNIECKVEDDIIEVECLCDDIPNDFKLAVKGHKKDLHILEDGEQKVMSFNEDGNIWIGCYKYTPDLFGRIHSKLFSFHNGKPFIHNEGKKYNTFYGKSYPSVVSFIINMDSIYPKLFHKINVLSRKSPDFVHVKIKVEDKGQVYYQSSDLVADDFEILKGVSIASFLRDRLSPNTSGSVYDKLMKGDNLRGQIAEITIVLKEYDRPISIREIGVGYTLDSGYNV